MPYVPITIAMHTDNVTMFGKIASLCRLFRASQVSSLYLKEYFMFSLIWLYHTWSFNLCTCQGSQWTPVQKSLFFLRYSLIFLQYLFWKYAIRYQRSLFYTTFKQIGSHTITKSNDTKQLISIYKKRPLHNTIVKR